MLSILVSFLAFVAFVVSVVAFVESSLRSFVPTVLSTPQRGSIFRY